jgi:hypothetical protein
VVLFTVGYGVYIYKILGLSKNEGGANKEINLLEILKGKGMALKLTLASLDHPP